MFPLKELLANTPLDRYLLNRTARELLLLVPHTDIEVIHLHKEGVQQDCLRHRAEHIQTFSRTRIMIGPQMMRMMMTTTMVMRTTMETTLAFRAYQV